MGAGPALAPVPAILPEVAGAAGQKRGGLGESDEKSGDEDEWGIMLSDYDSDDARTAAGGPDRIPCISLRVTKGASPKQVDESAIVQAFLEERFGARKAGLVEVAVYTTPVYLKYEAGKTWAVISLQLSSADDFRVLMRDFGAGGLADCVEYGAFREVVLDSVYYPGCGQTKPAKVAYCREGNEQLLPGAPSLGTFVGAGLLVTLLLENTLGLGLNVRAYNKLAGMMVMSGSSSAKSYDGDRGQRPWSHGTEGVKRQLEGFGLACELVKVADVDSPLNGCGVAPWEISGSRLKRAHRGARIGVRVTHAASRVGAGGVEPDGALPTFRLRCEVGWAHQVKPAEGTAAGKGWGTKLCSVGVRPSVDEESGYAVVALEDAEGGGWWEIGPAGGGAVPAGFQVAVKERTAKRVERESRVNAVQAAVRGAGAVAAGAAGQREACKGFLEKGVKSVLGAIRGQQDWRSSLRERSAGLFDPHGILGVKLMCPEGGFCGQQAFPCAMFCVGARAALVSSMRQALVTVVAVCWGVEGPRCRLHVLSSPGQAHGGEVEVAKAEFSFGEAAGAGARGSVGGGGGSRRDGGGGGGGKRRARAVPVPVVGPVKSKPKGGWGGGGGARGGKAGEAPRREDGSDSDGSRKKARSASEDESEAEARVSSAAMRRGYRSGMSVSFAGVASPFALGDGPDEGVKSALLEKYDEEEVNRRIHMLNFVTDSIINWKALPEFSKGETGTIDKVLAALQCEPGGENRKDLGWRHDSLMKACQVGALLASRAVLSG